MGGAPVFESAGNLRALIRVEYANLFDAHKRLRRAVAKFANNAANNE